MSDENKHGPLWPPQSSTATPPVSLAQVHGCHSRTSTSELPSTGTQLYPPLPDMTTTSVYRTPTEEAARCQNHTLCENTFHTDDSARGAEGVSHDGLDDMAHKTPLPADERDKWLSEEEPMEVDESGSDGKMRKLSSKNVQPVKSGPKHTDLSEMRSDYTESWDANHVRMPYSSPPNSSDYRSRWQCINDALKEFMNRPDLSRLPETIKKYNGRAQWDFDGITKFENSLWGDKEFQRLVRDTLPRMAELALDLQTLCHNCIPFLKHGKEHSITLNQRQIACLLANAFFCTFPSRNDKHKNDGGPRLPSINFNALFKAPDEFRSLKAYFNKLKCLFNYFNIATASKSPPGKVTYTRQVVDIGKGPDWRNSKKTFTSLQVTANGSIDRAAGLLEVDFANKSVGGGVLGRGCLQEEIRFIIAPELIAARLFTEVLHDEECLVITGCETYSDHSGFAGEFEYRGRYVDTRPRDSYDRKLVQVVAIDATKFYNSNNQFEVRHLQRELNKAYCGFRGRGRELAAVATGNWGCGDFRGDKHLKSLLQLMAATEAGRQVCYFTYRDEMLADSLRRVHSMLVERRLGVDIAYLLIETYRDTESWSDCNLHDFIINMLQADWKTTQ